MAIIDFKVFSDGSKKCLQIGNEEYVRPLLPLTWSRMRVGVLAAMVPDGTNNLSNVGLIMGMCNSYSGFSLANATNAIGYAFGANTGFGINTYTYNAGSGNPYFGCASGICPFKRVGGVITAGTANGATGPFLPTTTGSIQRAVPTYVDVIKGSPNYTLEVRYFNAAASAQTNYTLNTFYDGFEQGAGTVVLNGNSMTAGSQALAFSESTYELTSMFLYWQKTIAPIQIYAIGVARLV